MRTLITLLLLLAVVHGGFGQEVGKTIEAKIKGIVVYLDGAEMSYDQSVKLEKGKNKLIFRNVAPGIPITNYRIAVSGNVSILAIEAESKEEKDAKNVNRLQEIRDSVELFALKVEAIGDEQQAYEAEKKLLADNSKLGGTADKLTAADIEAAANLYRRRLIEINKKLSELRNATDKANTMLYRLQAAQQEQETRTLLTIGYVTVLLQAAEASTEMVSLRAITPNGGWSPAYEISVEDLSKDVELIYRANVYNNSGIDWHDIDLTLSTGDPWTSAAQPKLTPWYVDYYTISNTNYGYSNNMYGRTQQSMGGINDWEDRFDDAPPSEESLSDFEEVFVSELNVEFAISEKYTIPSDNKPYLVDMTTHSLPAKYKHFAVPKKDKDAFLIASITGWEELNLVEGEAKVFFGGSYVGKSYIYTRDVRDTLDISLGRDKKVLVTRSKRKDYCSTKFIGTKKRETHSFEMVVKNNRKTPIDIEILDQLPVSQNSEIEVEVEEISGAQRNETTGELKWNFTMTPAKSESITLTYSLKYPKTKSLNVIKQESKQREVRKF